MSQEQFDEALRLEEEGEQERALSLWRQLAAAHPTHNVFLRIASITQELGLTEDAESAFQAALRIDERSALALRGLGILAIERGEYEVAEAYLRRAGEIEEDPAGFSLLGVALRHSGKDLDAEQAYRRAIRLNPKYEEAYFNLGVLLRDDRPSEAQALFRTALDLDPSFACAHRELGFVLSAHGARPEALRHLQEAIRLQPDDAWAHIYLGTYFWLCANIDGAMSAFRTAGVLLPEWDVPIWSLGNIFEFEYRDFDQAQSYYERALQLEPDSEVASQNLGRLFKKRGRTDLAREYLERAKALNPETSGSASF